MKKKLLSVSENFSIHFEKSYSYIHFIKKNNKFISATTTSVNDAKSSGCECNVVYISDDEEEEEENNNVGTGKLFCPFFYSRK